jgi:hypothetical protein
MSARLLTRFMRPADGAAGKEEEEEDADGGCPSAACPPVMAAAARAWSLRFPREALLYFVWSSLHLNFFSSFFFSLLLRVNGMARWPALFFILEKEIILIPENEW